MRIAPPLTATQDEIDLGLDLLDAALEKTLEKLPRVRAADLGSMRAQTSGRWRDKWSSVNLRRHTNGMPPANASVGMVFPGVQKSTWSSTNRRRPGTSTVSTTSNPNLNTLNPEVQAEILKIMGFWIQLGAS
jgi:hypothetical protein